MARVLSLPVDRDEFLSDIVSSYRVKQGVLHNPRSDRRTTQGIFHVAEGGLPVPADLQFREYNDQPPAEKFVQWVWKTLKDKNIYAARKHAEPRRKTEQREQFCRSVGSDPVERGVTK